MTAGDHEMTTIDTITDEQILQLRAEAIRAGDFTLVSICNVALTSPRESDVRIARAECARVIGEATRTAEATDWRETVIGETITDEQIQDYRTAAGAAGDLAAVAVCEVALDAISADPNEDDAFTQAIEDAIGEHDQESARAEVARMYRDAWAAEQ